MKTCTDFPGSEECCWSCHDDPEPLIFLDDPEAMICCARLRNKVAADAGE